MNQTTTTVKKTIASSVPAPTDRMLSASDIGNPPPVADWLSGCGG
jgi:hypothetical protein